MSPALSRISSPDLDDKPTDEKPSNALPALDHRPAWQRAFIGDAAEQHDTQRALGSRHIMMIGASPSPLLVRRSPPSPAIGGTIGTGIFLSAGSVCALSLSSLSLSSLSPPSLSPLLTRRSLVAGCCARRSR